MVIHASDADTFDDYKTVNYKFDEGTTDEILDHLLLDLTSGNLTLKRTIDPNLDEFLVLILFQKLL